MTGLSLAVASSYGQLTLDFSATTGGNIQFNGSSKTFQFNGTNQWHITDEHGGSSSVGLFGSITAAGPFSYGAISSSGSGITLVQDAPVLGPSGHLVINDGVGHLLTGTVTWGDVATFATSGGALNTQTSVNLTGVSYTGANPDLQFLAAEAPGTLTLSFQFAGTGQTLTSLSTGTGPYLTSFSGSILVVPEPSSLAWLTLGGLSLLRLRRRK